MKRLNSIMTITGVGLMVIGLAMTTLNAQDPLPGTDELGLRATDMKCVTMLATKKCIDTASSACDDLPGCPASVCGACDANVLLPNKVCVDFPGKTCGPDGAPARNCGNSKLYLGECKKNAAGDCRCLNMMEADDCPVTQQYYFGCVN